MRPAIWNPPRELSSIEEKIMGRIKRAKLFTFLRIVRHELFDEQFQEELNEALYQKSNKGQPPIKPAQLALAIILQAYTGVSDDEAIECLTMDRRWQLVLDCLDCEKGPFAKGTLVKFRAALIERELDRTLIERTIKIAEARGGFSSRKLRAVLDSSPLWGAGRVEDTYNLLGHALSKTLSIVARQQGRELTEVAIETKCEIIAGSSLKASLDIDWDDPDQRVLALKMILDSLEAIESHLKELPRGESIPEALSALNVAQEIKTQDIELDSNDSPQLRHGVVKNRRISVEDSEMRHGRKSRSKRFDGYKRHVLKDLDSGLVRAVGVTRANAPEASVTPDLETDLETQLVELRELHIDRAYLNSTLVQEKTDELDIYCKAWPVRKVGRFPKTAFSLDWDQGIITCPNEVSIPFEVNKTVSFPKSTCAECHLRDNCTTSTTGRSVSIHTSERLMQELRERQLTPSGRARLRERVTIEHTLAHVEQWQGKRARYLGLRKNLFDLRRTAVVYNLHVLARLYNSPFERDASY